MGRSPCCSKVGMRRGPWSTKEDAILSDYILRHGEGQWRSLPKNAGLLRCGKSCRLRWMNYLRPGIKRGNINQDEEDLIVRMHRLLGNRWSLIAGRLPGRTDNEIKNYWNTHLLKKLHPEEVPRKPAKTKETGPRNQHKKKEPQTEFKVYLPKPIRVSSYNSLTISGASSSEADKVYWPSLLQLEDQDDCIMPLLQDSISGDAHMLYQVYDEYLQLL